VTTRQLLILSVLVVTLTLSLAWLIEKRQVLSLRQELNRWGAGADVPPAEREPGGPIVG